MASMSRHRPPHVAQGTWRSGALARVGVERHRHRRRWHGSTAGSGCSATTGDAPAGTTRRSPTGRSGVSASPSTECPHCTPHRCSSTRWARRSGCRICPMLPICPIRSPGSPESPSWPDAPCRAGASCPPWSRRARSPSPAGDPSPTRRSTACCSDSTPRCPRSARRVPAPTPPASTPSSSTASPAPCSTNTAGRPTSAANARHRSRRSEPRSVRSRSPTTWCAAAPSSSTTRCDNFATNSTATDGGSVASPWSSPACVS